jgi:uncharacterized protein (TIGR00269 family)
MRCDRCNSESVIFQPYSGLHLCSRHLVADVEAKAKRVIRTHHWMERNDHIAVALSGDKKSSALLRFFHTLTSERRDITLSAITIDEGITGYRDPAGAVNLAASLGIPCAVGSFLDEYGAGMDDIVARQGGSQACSYCGALRRFLLNRIAREQGVTKLALGSTLDDEALVVLTHLLNGEPEHVLHPEQQGAGMVQKIRPFMHIPEQEVNLYVGLHPGGSGDRRCPYENDPLMTDVRTLLTDYTLRHPSTNHSLVTLGTRISDASRAQETKIHTCERCGEPRGAVCPTCRIIGEVRGGAV